MIFNDYSILEEELRKNALSHKRQDNIAYCDAMEQYNGTTDSEVIKILFRSYTWGVETGMQQAVYGVLGTVDFKLYYQCLISSLPELINKNAQSAFELLDYPGREMSQTDVELVARTISALHETAHLVIKLIEENSTHEEYPWSEIYCLIKKSLRLKRLTK